ncbi:uncharacterized protein BT62DRAFT_272566 [Guyanagaster necrorhizus]|uniref:Uncharacterized protein n=1 Tax=Guyanagaster necrorhizus TaxID=856835 RepID=A0A9P7W3F7_9AGAR|nr:uncharacterized protein BT62DRAFT_272566 [Guyanagaster necrorhizus MCA 3950]KAG7451937.1 hypothetical protein BT62DRAFT_272566 [Guyanagaster necrorhizus MCA 3950]
MQHLCQQTGLTTRKMLDIMARFRVSVNESKGTWHQHPSRMRLEMDRSSGLMMQREDELRRTISSGTLSLDMVLTIGILR